MTESEKTIPVLDPPGKGLPFLEKLVARYYAFPGFCRKSDWESAAAALHKVSSRIISLTNPLAAEPMQKRILVSGIRGIEDSSRYWSVAMTLEHLVIVNTSVEDVVVRLTNHQVIEGVADTAAVKPKGEGTPDHWKKEYRKSVDRYQSRILSELGDRKAKDTFPHPWFGPLNAFRWHCIMAVHQSLHLKQVEAILRGM